MPPTTPNPGATFVVYLIVLVAICFVMMLLFKGAVWWGERYDMSSEDSTDVVRTPNELVRASGSRQYDEPVRGLPYQQNENVPDNHAPPAEPIILHNLSRAGIIALLAVQKDDSGKPRFSKNQIVDLVGGTRADVLKEIDQYRTPPPAPAPQTRADRPANGWN